MSYKKTKEQVEKLVENELQMALEQHGEFNSLHEAYAVTLEEFEEAESELEYVRGYLEGIKGTIFKGDPTYHVVKENFVDRINTMRNDATKLACEAIQVAAMAKKTLRFLNPTESVEINVENLKASEVEECIRLLKRIEKEFGHTFVLCGNMTTGEIISKLDDIRKLERDE